MNYIEFDIRLTPKTPWSEIIVAELAELGCDSFVDTEYGVKAYAPEDQIHVEEVRQLAVFQNEVEEVKAELLINTIEEQNWNAAWESDFEPVYVEEQLAILAPFHDASLEKELTVYIEPKMSFGTGHHQTTWMMCKALMDMKSVPSEILDMGSGTGVLAIVAEKLGGKKILAIDIEDWAYENAIDNSSRNNCHEITPLKGNVDLIDGKHFNLILANINKNVLTAHMQHYAESLNKGGKLFLSGFFVSDAEDLKQCATENGLTYKGMLSRDNWACLEFIK